MSSRPTVPLTIITGFLGAGKTTLLNRILHAPHGLRVAVLVNDFGAINIDAQLLVSVAGDTISLANGCICCTIRDDLIRAVLDVLARPQPPDYILVETSGVSDPLEVALSLRTVNAIHIDSILTVLDAATIMDRGREFELARLVWNQIGMADVLLLNKIDLVTDAQRADIHAEIHKISPRARILETVACAVPVALILGAGAFDPQRLLERPPQPAHVHEAGVHDHDHDHDHDHPDHSLVFSTWSWRSEQPLSYRAVRQMLDHLPEQVYRAKGIFFFAEDPERRGVGQVVGKRATLTPGDAWGAAPPLSQLVVIALHGTLDAADMEARLTACLAINQPETVLEKLADKALSWLRGQRH